MFISVAIEIIHATLSRFSRQALLRAATAFVVVFPTGMLAQVALDDLALPYHGIVLDKYRNVVEIDEIVIERLYSELANRYSGHFGAPDKLIKSLDAVRQNNRLLPESASPSTSELSLVDFLVDSILYSGADAPPHEYAKALNLLRDLRSDPILLREAPLDMELTEYFSQYSARNAYKHQKCEDKSVPTPPNYGDAQWHNRVIIGEELSMVQTDPGDDHFYPKTEIYFYKSQKPLGLCSLLLRFQAVEVGAPGPKELEIAGVICQSSETKRACFWENVIVSSIGDETHLTLAALESDTEAQKISEKWLNSASSTDYNHLSLACPICHSGNNAFVFYPGDLCYPSGGCVGDKRGNLTDPIGYDSAPTKIHEIDPSFSTNLCTFCHDIAFPDREFITGTCALIEFVGTRGLMPPWPETNYAKELTWKDKIHIPDSNPYKDSFLALREFCQH